MSLSDALRATLREKAESGQTVTYAALARDLAIPGPGGIATLTAALETLMEDDAAAGRPFLSALAVSRVTGLPAEGFFAKAASLGIHIEDRDAFLRDNLARLARATP